MTMPAMVRPGQASSTRPGTPTRIARALAAVKDGGPFSALAKPHAKEQIPRPAIGPGVALPPESEPRSVTHTGRHADQELFGPPRSANRDLIPRPADEVLGADDDLPHEVAADLGELPEEAAERAGRASQRLPDTLTHPAQGAGQGRSEPDTPRRHAPAAPGPCRTPRWPGSPLPSDGPDPAEAGPGDDDHALTAEEEVGDERGIEPETLALRLTGEVGEDGREPRIREEIAEQVPFAASTERSRGRSRGPPGIAPPSGVVGA